MKEDSILIHPASEYKRVAAQSEALHHFEELYVEEDAAPEMERANWLKPIRGIPGKIRRTVWKQKPQDEEAGDE